MTIHARLDSLRHALRSPFDDLARPLDRFKGVAGFGAAAPTGLLAGALNPADSNGHSTTSTDGACSGNEIESRLDNAAENSVDSAGESPEGNAGEKQVDNAGENIVRVQGKVEDIRDMPSCVLYVEESGRVHGRAVVKRATISGVVSGDIEASESVAVKATGRVQGSITAPRIALEANGVINGTLSIG